MSVNVVEAVLTATDRNYTSTMQKAMGVTDSFANKMKSGLGFGAWVAIGTKAVNTVFNAIGNGVDGAVKRFDTLNNFPKVMESLGFKAEDAQKGIDRLADGIDHLPTTLDAVASQAQQFVPMTGNIEKATDVTLALNNAMAAGGKDAASQQRAIEQWTKAMAKGKPDFEMWQSMVQTAPAQMDQLAKSILGADKNQNDLYESMKSGATSIEEVNDKMIELTNASDGFDIAGKHYDSFAVQAKNASAGIQMAMVNTNAAVQRNIEKIIRAMDTKMSEGGMGGLVENLMKIPDVINAIGGTIVGKIENIADLGSALGTLGAGIAALGLAPTLAGIAQGLALANKSLVGFNFATAALAALNPAVLFGGLLVAVGLISTAFGDEINSLIQTMTTKGSEIITNLGEGITSALPTLMAKGAETITNLINGIAANIPAIITQGTNIIITLVQGVVAAMPQLIPAAFNAIGQFLMGIGTALPQLITSGLQLIATLVTGIANNLPQLLTMAATAIGQFIGGIGQNLPQIIAAGGELLGALVQGIVNSIVHIPAAVGSVIGAIKDAITGKKTELETVGQNQGQSLTNSVAQSAQSNQGAIQAAGTQTGTSFGTGLTTAVSGIKIDTGSIQSSFSATAPAAQSSGTQAGTSFGTGVNAGVHSIVPDTTSVINGLQQAAPKATTAGRQVGTNYANGIKSAQGAITSASTAASNASTSNLRNGYSKAYSAGAYISQGMAAGMWSAVGSIRAAAAAMSAAADEAMRAKAKVASPSKVTKKTGKFIGQGLVVGLMSQVKAADNAGKAIVGNTLKTMKNAVKKGNFESVAKSVSTKITDAVTKGTKAMDSKFNSAYKKIEKDYKKKMDNLSGSSKSKKKQKKQLKAQQESTISTLKKLQTKLDKAYETQIKKASEKIEELGKVYQQKYDAIISQQNDFAKRLGTVDELFEEVTKKKNGVTTSKFIFADFKAEKKRVDALGRNIERLKKLLPRGLMDEIISMDTTDALTYTNQLLKQSTASIKAYGASYSALQASASKVSKNFYSDRVQEVKNQYTAAVEKEFKKLKSNLSKVGQQAVQGFADGMKKNKKKLDATTNALVNSIVAAAKKKLKIHSPSKVFESIGVYTGEGLAQGIDSTQRQVQASIDNMLQAADFNKQMANNRFNGSLSDEFDYNVSARYEINVPLVVNGREFARATADDMTAVQNQKETYNNRKLGIR